MYNFFIVTPIGFEKLACDELTHKMKLIFPEKEINFNLVKGGIELECDHLEFGLNLNSYLKIPTRILLRLKNQKCRDLPKLFNILKKFPWKTYLRHQNYIFNVSAAKSRLINTKRIEDTAKDALAFYFNANKISKKEMIENPREQSIFLRFYEDNLTISLDTTGDPLYKRSQHEYRGLAGIRENYCAACLVSLLTHEDQCNFHLLDPMCGSGTFLKEATNYDQLTQRKFSYHDWKGYERKNLKELPEIWNLASIKGIEIDTDVFKNRDPNLNIINKDFFNIDDIQENTIAVLNPPYGKRIKLKNPQNYFKDLVSHLKGKNNIIKFGLIIPIEYTSCFTKNIRLKFNQNGIKVAFVVF